MKESADKWRQGGGVRKKGRGEVGRTGFNKVRTCRFYEKYDELRITMGANIQELYKMAAHI
jgi:hypothetical protein